MNLITGSIEEIYVHDGTTVGKVNVRGAYLKVPLMFLMDARVGDLILIESGVAISRTRQEEPSEI